MYEGSGKQEMNLSKATSTVRLLIGNGLRVLEDIFNRKLILGPPGKQIKQLKLRA